MYGTVTLSMLWCITAMEVPHSCLMWQALCHIASGTAIVDGSWGWRYDISSCCETRSLVPYLANTFDTIGRLMLLWYVTGGGCQGQESLSNTSDLCGQRCTLSRWGKISQNTVDKCHISGAPLYTLLSIISTSLQFSCRSRRLKGMYLIDICRKGLGAWKAELNFFSSADSRRKGMIFLLYLGRKWIQCCSILQALSSTLP